MKTNWKERHTHMFKTMDDFFCLWETESAATLRIFNALTDRALEQKVCDDGRTVSTLAWHMVTSLGKMAQQSGVALDPTVSLEGEKEGGARAIASAYERVSAAVVGGLKHTWTDAMLAGTVPMFGDTWTRSKVLMSLILHQAHHRGQLTVLMRQAAVRVPGIYGPAREDWAAMGMPPMK